MQKFVRLVASCFFIGYLPCAPGTFASLLGVGLYLLAGRSSPAYSALIVLFLALGFLVSGRAEKLWNGKDSRKIVIDDLSGALLTFFMIPGRLLTPGGIDGDFMRLVIIGFLLFRAIDIIKPWPLRRLERLSGSAGVMLDDVAAGVAANVVLHGLRMMGWG